MSSTDEVGSKGIEKKVYDFEHFQLIQVPF